MRRTCGVFALPHSWPLARFVVAASMLGEAWHLAHDTNLLSQQIGHGTWWATAFAFGAVCVA